MRLIDADALADALFEKRKNYPQWVADTIGNMPDAVVRCKDCKYWLPMNRLQQDYHPDRGECELNCWVRDSDWFCADGEKRE